VGGSVEQIVWLLAREFTRKGHHVTVFACAGSEVDGELVVTLPGPYAQDGSPHDWQLCEWVNLCHAVEESHRLDVLHSHAYLWGLPLERLSSVPMLHTLHVHAHAEEGELLAVAPDACVTSISRYQWHELPDFTPFAVVPHGVDTLGFTFSPRPDDYVCYLGRFTHGKGPVDAVRLARLLGVRLVLAGPPNRYFEEHLRPLVDGTSIEYVGAVDSVQRDRLLGGARALLYPIGEAEPFGLVLIEAMMCGTPVLATRLGATPEIVDEGVTGYLGSTPEELARLAPAAFELDRSNVRARAIARFSAERMAAEYLEAYERLVALRSSAAKRPRAVSAT
jgi:glycosyltransferase involved in cell wall biosynthesis